MSTIESISITTGPGQSEAPTLGLKLVRLVLNWMAVSRSRRELADLTDEQLEDIGLTRKEARLEAEKPFWEGPQFR